MNASEIAQAVRTGQRRTRDAVEEALDAADRTQTATNAFTEIDHDGALARADRLDLDRREGRQLGPLAGVPVAVKDLIDHAGHVTTCGSSFYRRQATTSATVIDRLESADAVVLGRTGLHEFAFGFSSENPWFGPVRNPWDTERSPGGSSGGSAAAVAAGVTGLAIGTDTGGSIRVPAAMCGTWGLKVTHGRVPLTGVFPLAGSLDTVGPIGAGVTDLILGFRVMAGFDASDPWSVPDGEARPRPISRMAAPRIGVPQPWVENGPTSKEVRDGFAWAVEGLRELGATVVETAAPLLEPFGMINELAQSEIVEVHRQYWEDDTKHYGEDVHERLADAFAVTIDEAIAARRWRAAVQHAASRLFDDVDFLITPSVAALQKTIGDDTISIDGTGHFYRPVLSWFSALVNHLNLPALTAPLALEGKPPPSLQIIGPAWTEERLLELGRRLEHAGIAAFTTAANV